MSDVWYLLRRKVICSSWVTGRLFLEVCFRHLFLVDIELNQSTLYAANFGSWFFRVSIQWAFFLAWGLSSTSLFLIFDVDNKRDDVLEAADIGNGDDAKKSPSTIGTTRSKQWKTMETFLTPMKLHLLMVQFFWDFIIDLPFCLSVANIFFWCGRVCLHHGFLNERLLEMRMFGVWGGGMPFFL